MGRGGRGRGDRGGRAGGEGAGGQADGLLMHLAWGGMHALGGGGARREIE